MFTHLTDLRKAFLYYSLAIVLCLGLTLLSSSIGPRTPDLAMFTPVAAVLLTLLIFTRDGYSKAAWLNLGLHRAGFRAWPIAFLIPGVILTFAYSVVWISGVATFVIPANTPSASAYLLDLVLSITIVTLVGGLAEEIGWRGYLLPHLTSLGWRPAILLSGLLHGIWHLPILLGTNFYHGAGNRFIVVPLFLATLTMAGVCFGYLRLTTGSVWPAAITHSSFNIFWERLNSLTFGHSREPLEYLAGESGVLTLIALTATAAYLTHRLNATNSDKLL